MVIDQGFYSVRDDGSGTRTRCASTVLMVGLSLRLHRTVDARRSLKDEKCGLNRRHNHKDASWRTCVAPSGALQFFPLSLRSPWSSPYLPLYYRCLRVLWHSKGQVVTDTIRIIGVDLWNGSPSRARRTCSKPRLRSQVR